MLSFVAAKKQNPLGEFLQDYRVSTSTFEMYHQSPIDSWGDFDPERHVTCVGEKCNGKLPGMGMKRCDTTLHEWMHSIELSKDCAIKHSRLARLATGLAEIIHQIPTEDLLYLFGRMTYDDWREQRK